jgi:hypothetical protein
MKSDSFKYNLDSILLVLLTLQYFHKPVRRRGDCAIPGIGFDEHFSEDVLSETGDFLTSAFWNVMQRR